MNSKHLIGTIIAVFYAITLSAGDFGYYCRVKSDSDKGTPVYASPSWRTASHGYVPNDSLLLRTEELNEEWAKCLTADRQIVYVKNSDLQPLSANTNIALQSGAINKINHTLHALFSRQLKVHAIFPEEINVGLLVIVLVLMGVLLVVCVRFINKSDASLSLEDISSFTLIASILVIITSILIIAYFIGSGYNIRFYIPHSVNAIWTLLALVIFGICLVILFFSVTLCGTFLAAATHRWGWAVFIIGIIVCYLVSSAAPQYIWVAVLFTVIAQLCYILFYCLLMYDGEASTGTMILLYITMYITSTFALLISTIAFLVLLFIVGVVVCAIYLFITTPTGQDLNASSSSEIRNEETGETIQGHGDSDTFYGNDSHIYKKDYGSGNFKQQ